MVSGFRNIYPGELSGPCENLVSDYPTNQDLAPIKLLFGITCLRFRASKKSINALL